MYETCPNCHVKRNTLEAPICPVCPERMNRRFQPEESAPQPVLYTPASIDAFLNQFPIEVFEHRTRSTAKEVARRKQIIKTLRDIYKWSFPRIAELFQYSDHTTVLHLYNQR